MVSILDNKKISELVVIDDESTGTYEKINPETLATIVEDQSEGVIDKSVQDHINNTAIHMSSGNVAEMIKDFVTPDNIKAGSNVTIKKDGKDITISAGDVDTDTFLSPDSIIPEDETITITPIAENEIKIRANIPDVSGFTKQKNIKSLTKNIIVEYPEDSNDVILSGFATEYEGGKGIKVDAEKRILTNTMPDQIVTLEAGHNINIEGEYPNFKIEANNKASIQDWQPNTNYLKDDFCILDNTLFQCLEDHTSEAVFDSEKWRLIAGWSAKREYFNIEEETSEIVLAEEVPNKDTLIINVGGIVQQGQNYELSPDRKTITFVNPILPTNIVEVIIMSNVVLDTYDTRVNIDEWKEFTSYAVGNIVIYKNAMYICQARHISIEKFDATKWKPLCTYTRNVYHYDNEEGLTQIIIPEIINSKSDIMINAGNTVLQTSTFDLLEDKQTIVFEDEIEEGTPVEVTIISGATYLDSNVPTPNKTQVNRFLISNDEEGYNLVTKNRVISELGLSGFVNITGKANNILSVKANETDVEYISPYQLSSQVKVRNIINGFKTTIIKGTLEEPKPGTIKIEDDKISFQAGSILSSDETTIINLSSDIVKNPNQAFARGNNNGSMIGGTIEEWTQPIMTSNTSPYGYIITSDEQTDREGYRAMDGLKDKGNGWLVFDKSATWEYTLPYALEFSKVELYNQTSGSENHSKDIEVWIDTKDNIVGKVTLPNTNYGKGVVDFGKLVSGTVLGITIKNSYGIGVGLNEIKIFAGYDEYLTKNDMFNIYAISDDTGMNADIATSKYELSEMLDNLPSGYTKCALIGSFRTNDNWEIYNAYPQQDINESFIDGSLNGVVYNNYIETTMKDSESGLPVQVIEQWGENNGTNITFPIEFSKLLYVTCNGSNITAKSNKGFTVKDNIKVYWTAKGYK